LGPAGARLSFGDSSPRHVSGSAVHLPTKNPVCCHHSDCGWFDYCHPSLLDHLKRSRKVQRGQMRRLAGMRTRLFCTRAARRHPSSLHVPYPTLQEGIRCGGMLHELAKSPARGSCSTAPSASARPWRCRRAGRRPHRGLPHRGRARRLEEIQRAAGALTEDARGRGLCSKMCGGTGVGNPARLEADRRPPRICTR
jgi:hypothetical protein